MQGFTLPATPRRIGIVAELIGEASLAPMVEAAVSTFESRGFDTLVVASGKRAHEELAAWDMLARSDCDGYLVYLDCLDNNQLAKLISTRKNVVLANLNDVHAGALAASHLISNGHHQITMVTGPTNRCRVQHRSEGFMSQCKERAPHLIDLQTLEADLTYEGGANAMRFILASDERPSAVFFHSDQMALGALTICQKNRLRVPDDISLMGCGDTLAGEQCRPALCSINHSLNSVGDYFANRLVNMIDGVMTGATPGTDNNYHMPSLSPHRSVRNLNSNKCLSDEQVISVRERECLQWASIGKTSWEISQIVGLTESTVIYHLRNATRKLDAANRLHAVAKALKASIIEF